MRIENIGLPGSGKSTLNKEAMQALIESGHSAVDADGLDALDQEHGSGLPVLRRTERTRQSIHFSKFMQRHAALFVRFQACYPDALRNLALISAIGADLMKHQDTRKHLDSFWADEGFLHHMVHALLISTNWQTDDALAALPEFLALVPDPDLTVFTRLDPETSTKALLKRMAGFGRSASNAQKRLDQNFGGTIGMKARAEVLDKTADLLKARGANVLIVEGQGNLPKAVFQTINAVAPGLEVG